MKLQLLPSTFDDNGIASQRQHTCCFVIDDRVAIDAGSLAMSTNTAQKAGIRDVILTHAHLDHIAGLPMFIDDLFGILEEPLRIHATAEVIDALKQHIFNWIIYPDFSGLQNGKGDIMCFRPFTPGSEVKIAHLAVRVINVNHRVPSVGLICSDGTTTIATSGDTAEMDRFWQVVNDLDRLDSLLIECAFPNEFAVLAATSHHLTPNGLSRELGKFERKDCPIYIINLKPMYHDQIISELNDLAIKNLQVLEVGRVYDF